MQNVLIWDSREAEKEFGREVAALLKLSDDGTSILWPQPTSDPEDPQIVRPAVMTRIRI
jgi:hypothetical protein